MIRLWLGVVAAAVLGAGLIELGERGWGPVVVVHEGEIARVVGPREYRKRYGRPGLGWRVPLASRVERADTRWRYTATAPTDVETSDGARPEVSCFAIWRQRDFPSGGEVDPESLVAQTLEAAVRPVAAERGLDALLGGDRVGVEATLAERAREALDERGIEMQVAGIESIVLPGALRAMRERLEERARALRREVVEEPARIRAETQRDAQQIRAEAARDAEILRGNGEAEAARIYAEAHAVAPEFYSFQRRLEAYRKTLGANTTIVLPPDGDFLQSLRNF